MTRSETNQTPEYKVAFADWLSNGEKLSPESRAVLDQARMDSLRQEITGMSASTRAGFYERMIKAGKMFLREARELEGFYACPGEALMNPAGA